MKALIYQGPGKMALEDRPVPQIVAATDAIVKIHKTTICGTDLHISKGMSPPASRVEFWVMKASVQSTRLETGLRPSKSETVQSSPVFLRAASASTVAKTCTPTARAVAGFWAIRLMALKRSMCAFLTRTPAAPQSRMGQKRRGLSMSSDILPTGFECGVLNGKVQPGSTVAIVGAGPVGLAALLTAQFYAVSQLIVIDLDDNRLRVAARFGATHTVNSSDGNAVEKMKQLTAGRGVDTAIEAVGVPTTFGLCQELVAAGGTIANIGVHGKKVDLHLEAPMGPQHFNHNSACRCSHNVVAAEGCSIQEDRSHQVDYPSFPIGQDYRVHMRPSVMRRRTRHSR